MRLLHVIPSYLPAWRDGGPVAAVHGLCKALAARGHEVTVFTTDRHRRGTLEVPREQAVEIDGVSVWYFPVRPPRRLYRSPALAARLTGVAAYDLVHLHSVFLWPTAAAARAAEDAGVPYLVAPRGMLVAELLRRRGRLRKALWIRLVERHTLAHAAGLHVTSELEAEEAGRLGLPLPRLYVVPNGVESEPWDPAGEPALAPLVRSALARRPLLLFLGRLSWKKGLERLVLALAHLPGATLVIAGNDEENYRQLLDRLAVKAGVADRILYLGLVQGAAKAALLHRADLLVLPSLSENFGNVVLEAMAAGLAVAVTPEVALAGLVREARAGVVTGGEPARLASDLAALLADPAERQRMGERGMTAARRFDWPSIAARMEEVYGEVLAGSRARRVPSTASIAARAGAR